MLGTHISSSTQSSYDSATRSYLRFCEARQLTPFPADPVTLSSYMAFQALWISLPSLKLYLSAIKSASVDAGFAWTLDGNVMCARTLRGLKKQFGCPDKALKLPLSFSLLIRLFRLLPGWPRARLLSHDDRLFVTASLIGTTGFLRGGEFLCSQKSSRPVLKATDISTKLVAGRLAVVVAVAVPKARWWIRSQDVFCFPPNSSFETGESLSVASWWFWFRDLSPFYLPADGPAFVCSDGSVLSRDWLVDRTKELLSRTDVLLIDSTGRPLRVLASSWRAGGVASAKEAGVSDATIKAMGRWSSNAWLHYSLPSRAEIPSASDLMWAAALGEEASRQVRVGDVNLDLRLAEEDEEV